ncbi:hypothetical protein [Larkinella sp. C7]|uniref:hypothetical protein n=1 Tax=Larkinella sp. C7 TaxID=2576607 RepID=UPI0011112D11|nr:hypothetical protein [Larkinella sp. C7]
MNIPEKIDEINIKYNKWVIAIHLNNVTYHTIWGYDSLTKNGDTKLLLDSKKNILLFKTRHDSITAVLTTEIPVFDTEKTTNWAKEIQKIVNLYEDESVNNLDHLQSIIERFNFENIDNIAPEDAQNIVNFVNLFTDYADQIGDSSLLILWNNPAIKSFWEYLYNQFFWTIPADELKEKQAEVLENYKADACKKGLMDMLAVFKSRLVVYSETAR